jgi:murein DD-endopeptidase / murein LD-carboxypeptidase
MLTPFAGVAQTAAGPIADEAITAVVEDSLVSIAYSLIGVPYRYGGSDTKGFDCSGFVNYVYTKLGLDLPRSSRDMALLDNEVPLDEACKGDIILFAGHDMQKRPVGHAGIIVSDPGEAIRFIHSATSGKVGVIESVLDGYDYFEKRFVKLIRVL